jgi:hypothetical protein
MKKNIFLVLIFLFTVNFSYSVESKSDARTYVSLVDNLFLRKGPGKQDEVIMKLKKGDFLEIISHEPKIALVNDMEDYWYKVRTGGKMTGYVFGYYIAPVEIPFTISEKLGVVLFFNNRKVVNEVSYNSLFQETGKVSKNKVEKKDIAYDIPQNINDSFMLIKSVAGWVQSEYTVISYSIFDRFGKKICTNKGYPLVALSYKNRFLLINKAENKETYNITNMNQLDIYSFEGKFVKSINYSKIKPGTCFDPDTDKILFDRNEIYYIWITNTSALIINLKSFNCDIFNYDFSKFNEDENFFMFKKAVIDEKSRMLIVTLDVFPKKNDIKPENKSINIEINLKKY